MRIVVVGTGTDVGKTHATVALVSALARDGQSVCGLKPVESGVPAGEVGADGRALAEAGVFHVKHPQPYALPDAVSPHLAARRACVVVELQVIRRWVDQHQASWVFIETAGGLLSPLGPKETNLDLAVSVAPDGWVLVGVDRLGTLHDVAACLLALHTRLSTPPAHLVVLLQTPALPDASTGTNADELRTLGVESRVVTMPRGVPTSPACQAAARNVLSHFK